MAKEHPTAPTGQVTIVEPGYLEQVDKCCLDASGYFGGGVLEYAYCRILAPDDPIPSSPPGESQPCTRLSSNTWECKGANCVPGVAGYNELNKVIVWAKSTDVPYYNYSPQIFYGTGNCVADERQRREGAPPSYPARYVIRMPDALPQSLVPLFYITSVRAIYDYDQSSLNHFVWRADEIPRDTDLAIHVVGDGSSFRGRVEARLRDGDEIVEFIWIADSWDFFGLNELQCDDPRLRLLVFPR